MFKRKGRTDSEAEPQPAEAAGRASDGAQSETQPEAATSGAAQSELPPTRPPVDRSNGPFDSEEVPDTSGYVDFGALLVANRPDISMGLEQDPSTRRAIGVTILRGSAALQLRLFAAPRSGGHWEQNRQLLLQQLEQAGASAQVVEGAFGVEVRAAVPAPPEQPGASGRRPLRFVGVEGPRWLLRGAFSGEGADPKTAAAIEEVFRGVVVVRGEEAMPVGAMIMLTAPPAPEPAERPSALSREGSGGPTIESLEPGPRITEVR